MRDSARSANFPHSSNLSFGHLRPFPAHLSRGNMFHRVMSFSILGLWATVASAADFVPSGLPLFAGDSSVANFLVHGNAHVLAVGDSITLDVQGSYAREWTPDHW